MRYHARVVGHEGGDLLILLGAGGDHRRTNGEILDQLGPAVAHGDDIAHCDAGKGRCGIIGHEGHFDAFAGLRCRREGFGWRYGPRGGGRGCRCIGHRHVAPVAIGFGLGVVQWNPDGRLPATVATAQIIGQPAEQRERRDQPGPGHTARFTVRPHDRRVGKRIADRRQRGRWSARPNRARPIGQLRRR